MASNLDLLRLNSKADASISVTETFPRPTLTILFFVVFSGHSLFVYQLIVATLIGNFFDDPFLNQNLNFCLMMPYGQARRKRVK